MRRRAGASMVERAGGRQAGGRWRRERGTRRWTSCASRWSMEGIGWTRVAKPSLSGPRRRRRQLWRLIAIPGCGCQALDVRDALQLNWQKPEPYCSWPIRGGGQSDAIMNFAPADEGLGVFTQSGSNKLYLPAFILQPCALARKYKTHQWRSILSQCRSCLHQISHVRRAENPPGFVGGGRAQRSG